VTFDGIAEERDAGIYLSALVNKYTIAIDSHGAFAREVEPEGLELDVSIEREAEGERFALCGRSSSPALRFILALLSLSWSLNGVEDFPLFSILDGSIASSGWRRKRCRLFGYRRVREEEDAAPGSQKFRSNALSRAIPKTLTTSVSGQRKVRKGESMHK
jgi:hypothetical protein